MSFPSHFSPSFLTLGSHWQHGERRRDNGGASWEWGNLLFSMLNCRIHGLGLSWDRKKLWVIEIITLDWSNITITKNEIVLISTRPWEVEPLPNVLCRSRGEEPKRKVSKGWGGRKNGRFHLALHQVWLILWTCFGCHSNLYFLSISFSFLVTLCSYE